jgi:hypothetical protein
MAVPSKKKKAQARKQRNRFKKRYDLLPKDKKGKAFARKRFESKFEKSLF